MKKNISLVLLFFFLFPLFGQEKMKSARSAFSKAEESYRKLITVVKDLDTLFPEEKQISPYFEREYRELFLLVYYAEGKDTLRQSEIAQLSLNVSDSWLRSYNLVRNFVLRRCLQIYSKKQEEGNFLQVCVKYM